MFPPLAKNLDLVGLGLKWSSFSQLAASPKTFNLPQLRVLNKKEQRACDSPDAVDCATDALTPNTEAKYKKINDEFEHMIKSRKMSSLLPPNLPHPGGGGASDGRTTATDNHPQENVHATHGSGGTPDAGDTPSNCELILQNGSGTDATRFVESPLKIAPPRSSARKSDPRALTPAAKVSKATPGEQSHQSSPALNTPVVSISTPSLTRHSLLYGNDYEISSAEMSNLTPPIGPSLNSINPWQQQMSSAMGEVEEELKIA
ncbi:myocyte-specific enhancer factor 2C-like isoform X2 [Stigmatopora argus]